MQFHVIPLTLYIYMYIAYILYIYDNIYSIVYLYNMNGVENINLFIQLLFCMICKLKLQSKFYV